MPSKRSADSLRRQCLHSIARDMDKVWSSDFYSNFRDVPRLYYVIGPFCCLTTEMTQELINILAEQRLLKRHHLQILIRTHLKQLDLEVCGPIANHDSVMRMVGVRCQILTKLNLSSLNHISTKMLVDLIYNVPQIQSLILQNTKCNDQVMAVIGRTCCQLRELNVFSCSVTDSGAFGLCVKSSSAGGAPNCSQLVSLDIGATAVSLNGASALLQTLHRLKYFHYCDVCAVFEKLYLDSQRLGPSFTASQNRSCRVGGPSGSNNASTMASLSSRSEAGKDLLATPVGNNPGSIEDNNNGDDNDDISSSSGISESQDFENFNDTLKPKRSRERDRTKQAVAAAAAKTSDPSIDVEEVRKYGINSLTATGIQCSLVTAQSIKIACEVCPNVTEVYLHQNIGNRGMAHLTQLSQLHVLEVVSCAPDPITFEEGLVPVLQKVGSSLFRLSLYDFADIDIIRIGQYCPQLHHLNLESSMCDFIDYDVSVLKNFIINTGSFRPRLVTRQPNSHDDGGVGDDAHACYSVSSKHSWTRQSRGFGSTAAAISNAGYDNRLSRCMDDDSQEGLFAHIRSLRIILLSETNNFPADVLRLILINSRHLIHLHLTNMQFLTDDLLVSVLMLNPLSFLQTLVLELCNSVDRHSVMRLLADEQNGLQRLDLIECQSITRRDFEYFQEQVRKDNVDVTITWM